MTKEAPRQRAAAKTRTPAQVERDGYRGKQTVLTKQRAEELARGQAVLARARAGLPHPTTLVRPQPKQDPDIAARVNAARAAQQAARDRQRGERGHER